ncbi:MAG TPA: methyltransferase domain-containing protein, partial [Pirellulales bacterium]|nr:methyltransferase domain-containing protein [Pirellulales bacterium]
MARASKLFMARSVLFRASRLWPLRAPRILASLGTPNRQYAHLYAPMGSAESTQPSASWLRSCLCTERQFHTREFQAWCAQLGEAPRMHRKAWEIYYICQALAERGMLQPGRRGLGFAVGREPLPAVFAARGCEIVASDLAADDRRARIWTKTSQHASNLAGLNARGLCEAAQFARLVSFRYVDMNAMPEDLRDFDFTWSMCAFEHVGSIDLGLRFIQEQMRCLRPGGVAVHTTEFNVSSNTKTLSQGECVLFRRRDIEALAQALTQQGHKVEPLDLDLGSGPVDRHVDVPPYCED